MSIVKSRSEKDLGAVRRRLLQGLKLQIMYLSLGLSEQEKVMAGSQIEGHADNVSAALLGGAVVSYFDGENIDYIHIEKPTVGVVVLVPPEVLPTEDSRSLIT